MKIYPHVSKSILSTSMYWGMATIGNETYIYDWNNDNLVRDYDIKEYIISAKNNKDMKEPMFKKPK